MMSLLLTALLACHTTDTPAPIEGTLARVEMGAVNCEVTLEDGVARTASWHLCPGKDMDAAAMVGRSVRVTFDVAFVQSEDCAGRTNCMDLVETAIVDTIEAR